MNPVTFGANVFCGPAVISAVAGVTTDEAAKLVQDLRRSSRPVKAMYNSELIQVFSRLGFNTVYLDKYKTSSLFYLLHSVLLEPGTYVFMVPGHFIAIEINSDGRKYICDNHTKKPLNVTASARLSQKVTCVLRITKCLTESTL